MKTTGSMLDIGELNQSRFMALYGGLYEHSPWIAAQVWTEIQNDASITVDALALKLKNTVDAGTREQKMDLLCAHPELAGKAATEGSLTAESTEEQSRARLDLCSAEEFEQFHQLNSAYNEKFSFPFIMAVRNSSRTEILQAFEARLQNSEPQEFETALEQVHQIARLRLDATVAADTEQGQ
ncbi:OHCU decarboxylase [Chromatiales bacterium (ex Bugula neritina AB1)]|nr:OHCU decarboxylase [Chromatiales bacterium (ex Bugula neritina AB1)]